MFETAYLKGRTTELSDQFPPPSPILRLYQTLLNWEATSQTGYVASVQSTIARLMKHLSHMIPSSKPTVLKVSGWTHNHGCTRKWVDCVLIRLGVSLQGPFGAGSRNQLGPCSSGYCIYLERKLTLLFGEMYFVHLVGYFVSWATGLAIFCFSAFYLTVISKRDFQRENAL